MSFCIQFDPTSVIIADPTRDSDLGVHSFGSVVMMDFGEGSERHGDLTTQSTGTTAAQAQFPPAGEEDFEHSLGASPVHDAHTDDALGTDDSLTFGENGQDTEEAESQGEEQLRAGVDESTWDVTAKEGEE